MNGEIETNMECLVRITTSNKNTKRIGSSFVLTKREFDLFPTDELKNSKRFKIDDMNILHHIFNADKTFKHEFVQNLISGSHESIFKNILELNNIEDCDGWTLAHVVMCYPNYEFTIDELLMLGNPANKKGETIAHLMADHGHKFTVDEILKLGNPTDKDGWTIAHNMIYKNHEFTLDELIQLGNTSDKTGLSMSRAMERNGYKFTKDELLKLSDLS